MPYQNWAHIINSYNRIIVIKTVDDAAGRNKLASGKEAGPETDPHIGEDWRGSRRLDKTWASH